MAIYTALVPPGARRARLTAGDAERTIFVKDGFAWPALFFPLLWTLWHRLWLVFLGYLAVAVAVEAMSAAAGGPAIGAVAALFALLFAFEANALRRWTLERRGWTFAAAVSGSTQEEAEARFFARYQGLSTSADAGDIIPPQAGRSSVPSVSPAPRVGTESVVGLTLGGEFGREER